VIRLAASAYTIPTDAPEADGTLEWTSTTLVLVEAGSEEWTGIGWTYGPAVITETVASLLAPALPDVGVLDPPAAHERMCRAVRNAGRSGMCSMAISAVDCALWDLKARRLGLPLHRLLGAVRDEVPVYGSGGFTTYDATRMRVAAGEYGYDLPYFARLIEVVDCPQADVTRVGGITEFLRVAGLARAHGRDLSAHCAPHQHVAVMAAIPNARHIEWFHDHVRIESMLFDGALDPSGGTVRPREDAPGLGLEFRRQDAERYRVT
jgi:L-alanine-DL-glutamate epimerase-like enolase superfamily enzyme